MPATRDLRGEIEDALADPTLQRALRNAMDVLYARRASAFVGFDFEDLRSQARAIKEESLADGDELLDLLEEKVTDYGGTLYRAATAADACSYITRLAQERGVRRVVKAKSMTSEEIHLNHALEELDIDVVETDLGERIIQLAGERPSHLVVPAIHRTKEQVIELIAETMAVLDPPQDAEGLTRLVREDLRERFLAADMGITGANFVVAETGSLLLCENEGNIRLTSQLPPIHVALVGREKIIRRLSDLAVFLELLPRSGTGQLLTSYVSLITGMPSTDVVDFGRAGDTREREFHLVVLDNGRAAAANDPELREALYCIRCGACLNACAPYTLVGGHVYGVDPYPGGIGCAWTYITKGHAEAKQINSLCTTCSRCTEVCPVKIDIPWLNTVIKERNHGEFGTTLRDRVFSRTDLMGSVFGAIAPVVNPVLGTSVGRLPLAAIGVDPSRHLPRYERESLEAWFRRRGPVRVAGAAGAADKVAAAAAPGAEPTPPLPAGESDSAVAEGVRASVRDRVALFVDCFVNHNLPEVGKAAVELLERAGVEVVLSHNECCGRPAMSQGLLAQPRAWAAANLRELGHLIDQGYDIVCIEPSCLSALRDDYRRLLETTPLAGDPRIAALEKHAFDVTEYLLLRSHADRLRLRFSPLEESFIVHGHCHQKSLHLGSIPAELLRLVPGATVHEVEALCCGLVGSFGYKAEYSALSRAIGSQLFGRLGEVDGQVVACGISCRSQIEHGTARAVVHPVEVLHRALLGPLPTT